MNAVQKSPESPIDPFSLMTPAEFDSYRGKLLAIEKSSSRVIANEEILPNDFPAAPIKRIQTALAAQYSERDWYLLPGPPTGTPTE